MREALLKLSSARTCALSRSRRTTSSTCRRSIEFGIGLSCRTAVINQIRAFLLERGTVFAQKLQPFEEGKLLKETEISGVQC